MIKHNHFGFTFTRTLLVVTITLLISISALANSNESSDSTNTGIETKVEKYADEIPFLVKLWPFGPYGFICQHVAPVAYTEALRNLFINIGGCDVNKHN